MLNDSSFGVGFGDFEVILLSGSTALHILLLPTGSVRVNLGRNSFDLSEVAVGTHASRAAGGRAAARVAVGTRVENFGTSTRDGSTRRRAAHRGSSMAGSLGVGGASGRWRSGSSVGGTGNRTRSARVDGAGTCARGSVVAQGDATRGVVGAA